MKSRNSPAILRFLDAILPPDIYPVIGDLEEEYHFYKKEHGTFRAGFRLGAQIFSSLPYFLSESLTWNVVMLINYLKVTWRNVKAHKSFSLINILGLAASLSVCLLIILFIYDQKSYDRFHENSDHTYRVITDYKSGSANSSEWFATSPDALSDLLIDQLPQVKQAVHVQASLGGEAKASQEVILPINGIYTTPSFFELFNFELVAGNPQSMLSEPGSIVLTEKSAVKFFGDSTALGKTLEILGDQNYTVTGIIRKNTRTHFPFEAIASASSLSASLQVSDWTQHFSYSYTYVLLDEMANVKNFEDQLAPFVKDRFPGIQEANINDIELQPLTEINLGRILNNEIGTVMPNIVGYFLIGFAIIIILIACFNYISLTIARSLNRSKEVGVRKVLGAFRSKVVKQFIFEAIFIAFLALIFALAILRWLLPEFNSLYLINLSNSQISFDLQNDFLVFLFFLGASAVVGLLAGLYPALYLSKFKPAVVLKGIKQIRGFSALTLRKIIIVAQFSFSIIFIITSVLLVRQFEFMANTDYGFEQDHIVHIALQDVPYDRFRDAVSANSGIKEIASTSKVPGLGSVNGMWANSDSVANRLRVNSFEVDERYLEVMNLNLVAGRNFDQKFGSDRYSSIILNLSSVKQLNLGTPEEAIGAPVSIEENSYNVIGVVENFISSTPLQNNDPSVLLNNPDHFYYAAVKTYPNSMQSVLPFLKETWYKLESKYPIQYQIFNDQLRSNPIVSIFGDFIKVLGLIALFIILISCLGLLGMAIYTSENRTKEIGIRKVMGASISDIILLLSKEYLWLIGIATAIGGPAAWFLNQLWLQNISNKIEIGAGIFLIGILGTALLALLTIGSQTIQAAKAKSVENLQSE